MDLPDFKLIGGPRKEKSRGKPTRNWHQRYRLDGDPVRKVYSAPCCRDKQESRRRADEFVRAHIRGRLTGVDSSPMTNGTALKCHLDEFEAHLRSQIPSLSEKHIVKTVVQTRKIVEGCRFTRYDQIDIVKIDEWLAKQRHKGVFGESTSLKYLKAVKQFTRWALRNRRFPHDPLLHVSIKTREIPRERERRVTTDEEFNRLLHAAAAGKITHRLTGRQRMFVYLIAAETGLRASELASLRPSSFNLDADPPSVTVACSISKRRRTDRIELRPGTAEQLRAFLAEYESDEKLWPGHWFDRAAEMLRVDLEAAQIPYESSAGTYDFHAHRHGFCTAIAMSGAPMSIVQEICRLSTPRLVERYFHAPDTAHTRVLASLPKRSLPEECDGGA